MKRWMTALVSISAVAGVAALVLFLAGALDGDSATNGDDASIAPGCALGFPDCDDTPVQDNETGEALDGLAERRQWQRPVRRVDDFGIAG